MKKSAIPVICLILCIPLISGAFDIRVLAPYAGLLSNNMTVSRSGQNIDLNDTGILSGLFFLYTRPLLFQFNAFIYQSSNVNYGDVLGFHAMGDYYFGHSNMGSFVAGGGVDMISIDMDADSNSMELATGGYTSFRDFEVKNKVTAIYLRSGYRVIPLESGIVKFTVLPWAGLQYQAARGKVEIDFPAFQYPKISAIDSNKWYLLGGLGLNLRLFYFINLEGKYHATINGDELFPTVSAMTNVYVTRRIGVSYRFKYMEMADGMNLYNMIGVALLF